MNEAIDEFKQEYIDKYGKEKVIEYGAIYLDFLEEVEDLPITNIARAAMHLCEAIDCKRCPVTKFNYDMRVSENDKDAMLCFQNLIEWLIDQAQLTCKDRLDEYRRTVVYEPADNSEQASDTVSE